MYPKEFLDKLFSLKLITKYASITYLDLDERPLEEITGKITSGSISKNLNSNVLRVCNLSLVAEDQIIKYKWALKSKFRLKTGLLNKIDKSYPDIIWFELGVYVITSFNASYSNALNINISISGKDKMCLLNGELGGKFHALIDFGSEEYVEYLENGESIITKTKTPIKTIIRKMLRLYGNELPLNIIIEGLLDYGLLLLEYSGLDSLYLFRLIDLDFYSGLTVDGNTNCTKENGETVLISKLGNDGYDKILTSNFYDTNYNGIPVKINDSTEYYYVAKIDQGDTVGYKLIDLVYPQELIGNIGESITSILDKIVSMLGDFEYFYNVNGQFVFKRTKEYVGQSWSPLVADDGETYTITGLSLIDLISEEFKDKKSIVSLSYTSNINNFNNDFSLWGVRKGASGQDLPIHIRYAIDTKPTHYKTLDGIDYFASDEEIKTVLLPLVDVARVDEAVLDRRKYVSVFVDWRELIYQMAKDWYLYNYYDDFEVRVLKANPDFINGKTKYELYYPDMFSFWRQLYDPLNGGFKEEVKTSPMSLNFWFNFLDPIDAELEAYSVKEVGDRLYAKLDNSITAIYYNLVPNIIYRFTNETENFDTTLITGYVYVNINSLNKGLFTSSSKAKDAISAVEEEIYNRAYCAEQINMTVLPNYYLLIGMRVRVNFEADNEMNGDYIITSISDNLSYNGTTSLGLLKVPIKLL